MTVRQIRVLPSIVLFGALCLGRAPAHADDASEAELRFQLGIQHSDRKRYSEAIEQFLQSNRLVPNAGVVENIATIYHVMGKAAESYNWIETLLQFPNVNPEQRERVDKLRKRLLPKVAVVRIESTPAEAEIFIDSESLGSVGRTPRGVATAAGERRIILRRAGFREASAGVTTALGQETAVTLTLLPITGRLTVTSDPAGAEILDGDVPLGKTPLSILRPEGVVQVVVRLPGHVEQSRSAPVRADAETKLAFALMRAASAVATLTVSGRPEGAEVSLENQVIGKVPFSVGALAPGEWKLMVARPGYDSWSQRVVLEAGAATRVEVSLVDPVQRAWPGWKWVGYGSGAALLAAGGIVGLLAVSKKNAFEESANPMRATYNNVNTMNVTADVLLSVGVTTLIATAVIDWLHGPPPQSSGTVGIHR